MDGTARRRAIVAELEGAERALPGSALAEALGVSRQVIVQDVALLRSQGHPITSTNRGYVLQRDRRPRRAFKVRHSAEQAADELYAIVDLGGTVEDVVVNHRVYGMISARLDLSSRRDVRRYLDDTAAGKSTPLSGTTAGYHFHHVSADSEEVLDEVGEELGRLGFLAELTDYERERGDL